MKSPTTEAEVGDRVKILECALGGESDKHVGLVGELISVINMDQDWYEVLIDPENSEVCYAKKVIKV